MFDEMLRNVRGWWYGLGIGKIRDKEKGLEMKFVIRRALVALLALPLVAGAYVFGFLALEVMGASSGLELAQIWNNGFLIGAVSAVAFAFATQLDKFISKIVGE